MKVALILGNTADTGGPTKYAENLLPELTRRGHTVTFVQYAPWLWYVPFGVRHLFFAVQLLPTALGSDVMVGFDTMSVGLPMWLVSLFTRTRYVLRVGGDFVWEQFVESTGRLVKLSRFYDTKDIPVKQRLEIWLTRMVTQRAAALIFNAAWLRDIWKREYMFDAPTFTVENLYPTRQEGVPPTRRMFVSAGRPIKLKQEPLLREIFVSLKATYPDIELDTRALSPQEHAARLKTAYAFILPSVSDVSPNVIIDALTFGKPFVCTDDTGIKERLEGTGLFVDTSNKEALRKGIESLLDAQIYAQVEAKIKAFSFVRTWEDVGADFERILTTL